MKNKKKIIILYHTNNSYLCLEIDDIQLVGRSSRCSGELQVKSQGVWTEVDDRDWNLKLADAVCRHLDCGSVAEVFSNNPTFLSSWRLMPFCLNSGTELRKCFIKRSITPGTSLGITCSGNAIRSRNAKTPTTNKLRV